MDKKDKDFIRDSFDDVSENAMPPMDLWGVISNDLGDAVQDDEALIKQSFIAECDKEPNHQVWENINEELNLDTVWGRLKKSLDGLSQWAKWRRRILRLGGALSLLLLLKTCGIGDIYWQADKVQHQVVHSNIAQSDKAENAINHPSQYTISLAGSDALEKGKEKNPHLEISENNKIESRIAGQNTNTEPRQFFSKTVDLSSTKGSLSRLSSNKSKTNSSSLVVAISSTDEEQNSLTEKSTQSRALLIPVQVDTVLPTAIPLTESGEIVELVRTKKKKSKLGVELGGIMSIGSSLFLNYETLNAWGESLVETKAHLSVGYGLSAHLILDTKNRVGADIFVRDGSAQRYFSYSSTGQYLTRDVHMNYSKLSLFYQRTLWEYGEDFGRTGVYLKTGFYGAFLGNRQEVYNHDQTVRTTQNYRKIDAGANIALGQSHQVGRFVLDYGAFSELGFVNVFAGDGLEPAHLKPTRLLDFGGYLSLRYRF